MSGLLLRDRDLWLIVEGSGAGDSKATLKTVDLLVNSFTVIKGGKCCDL